MFDMITEEWLLGAIDVSSSYGISVSLQDKHKPYLKFFFAIKTRDYGLAERIKDFLQLGTVRCRESVSFYY